MGGLVGKFVQELNRNCLIWKDFGHLNSILVHSPYKIGLNVLRVEKVVCAFWVIAS